VTARFAVDRSTGVTADHDIVLTGANGRASPARLRQVRYRDAASGKRDVFWTIAVHLAAITIAAIDKQRWPIELFLKAITQHLRIKTFLGTSENAVMTQMWVALITDLILGFLRFKAG
jgi:IS4 transposase